MCLGSPKEGYPISHANKETDWTFRPYGTNAGASKTLALAGGRWQGR
uniref:Uncharacterized protein n=1 Tax=Arundo donax TaxID=35708 RepID=A0A0A9BTL9_ARUDO